MAQAGSYRRRMDIQKQVTVKDTTGNGVPSWQTIWSAVPCSVAPWRSSESFSAQQTQADVQWRIAFRWRPGLDASMRLVERSAASGSAPLVYNIESVMSDATDRREISLLCRTRLGEGFRSDGG